MKTQYDIEACIAWRQWAEEVLAELCAGNESYWEGFRRRMPKDHPKEIDTKAMSDDEREELRSMILADQLAKCRQHLWAVIAATKKFICKPNSPIVGAEIDAAISAAEEYLLGKDESNG